MLEKCEQEPRDRYSAEGLVKSLMVWADIDEEYGDGHLRFFNLLRKAAAEIERLRREIENLRT